MRRTSVIQSHGDWNIYDNQQFRIQRVKVSGFFTVWRYEDYAVRRYQNLIWLRLGFDTEISFISNIF